MVFAMVEQLVELLVFVISLPWPSATYHQPRFDLTSINQVFYLDIEQKLITPYPDYPLA